MELRQLEYFVAVVEEAGFTRAAERVRISQSGVSAQIRSLERELGAVLIDRSSRLATATVAGEAALVHARAALAAARAMREAVQEITAAIRGRLRVGMVSGCTVTPLFEALAEFHRAQPGVDLLVSEASSDELVARVRAGRLDLALVGVPAAAPSDLESLSVISEGIAALVPGGHPLARRTSIGVADLAGQQLICMPNGTGVRAVLDLALAGAPRPASIRIEASAPAAIVDLARRGLGIAVLSESMAAIAPDLVALPITDASVPAALALIWTPQPGPALRRLVAECVRRFDVEAAAPLPGGDPIERGSADRGLGSRVPRAGLEPALRRV